MGQVRWIDSQVGDGSQPACYDIVIVGAGPAGLMLSACLSRWGYKIRHIDNRPQPTPAGRADGINPRSMDLLSNMGLKPAIMAHSPARIYESAFWAVAGHGRGIARTGTSPSCPGFLNARYPYTTLLHQGMIENVFISDIEQRGGQIRRPWTITGFENNGQDPDYPVTVRMAHINGTATETVHAKYLFSGEGAKSSIRKQLGIKVRYKEPTICTWAVIDGLVRSDFPDIKMSCSIHSEHGCAMLIPRENDMVRIYVRLSDPTDADWNPTQMATEGEIQQLAKKILKPYFIEWDYVEWFSTYRVRQGIAGCYSLDQRVFLGGDACHTHSPKAGQGMNTAFLDSLNLAWKIHMVERGFAHRDIFKTYEHERKGVANTLIEFDNHYSKLYSQQISLLRDSRSPHDSAPNSEFSKAYRDSRAFVSGYGICYGSNVLNWSPEHAAQSPHLQATRGKLAPGHLFITADVTRVVDATPVFLEQAVPLNGSFRIYVFAGNPSSTANALRDLSKSLVEEKSFCTRFLRHDADRVSWHEKHNPHSYLFTFCLVFAAKRQSVEVAEHVPGFLSAYRHHVYADDRQGEGTSKAVAAAAAHSKAGIDARCGGVVVVRPDGYVGAVVRLVEGAGTAEALNEYFTAISSGSNHLSR